MWHNVTPTWFPPQENNTAILLDLWLVENNRHVTMQSYNESWDMKMTLYPEIKKNGCQFFMENRLKYMSNNLLY
jgi:hypothetical protein